ncbi:MAG: hypothetical protein ACLTBV_25275 [Enterocloster bolteae]
MRVDFFSFSLPSYYPESCLEWLHPGAVVAHRPAKSSGAQARAIAMTSGTLHTPGKLMGVAIAFTALRNPHQLKH